MPAKVAVRRHSLHLQSQAVHYEHRCLAPIWCLNLMVEALAFKPHSDPTSQDALLQPLWCASLWIRRPLPLELPLCTSLPRELSHTESHFSEERKVQSTKISLVVRLVLP